MKSNKIIYILLGVFLAVLLLVVVGKKAGWIKSNQGTEVAVQQVEKKDISESVPANGKLYSQTEVKISPEVSGEIIDIYVKEGEAVKKGQLLLKINPNIYTSELTKSEAYVNQMKANESSSKANLAQVQAAFEQAKQSYDRNKSLYKQKVISDQELETAFSQFKTASANYDAAIQNLEAGGYSVKSAMASLLQTRQNLDKTTIYAPIDGIVSKLNVEKGERVLGTTQMAGTELLRISDLYNMEARVDINENDILRIKIGDTSDIEIDAYLNRKFKGVVTEIAYASKSDFAITTDQVTNFTVKIKLMFSSYADLCAPAAGRPFPFRPGMSATASIQTNRKQNVLSVPIQSVTTRDLKAESKAQEGDKTETKKKSIEEIVFVVENGKAKAVKVKTGIQDDSNIEIVSGLTGAEKVITAPYKAISKTLADGEKVVIKTEEELYKTDKK